MLVNCLTDWINYGQFDCNCREMHQVLAELRDIYSQAAISGQDRDCTDQEGKDHRCTDQDGKDQGGGEIEANEMMKRCRNESVLRSAWRSWRQSTGTPQTKELYERLVAIGNRD